LPKDQFEQDDIVIGTARKWAPVLVLFVLFGSGAAMTFYYFLAPSPFRTAPELPNPGFGGVLVPQDNSSKLTDLASLRRNEDDILDHAGPSVVHPGKSRIPIEQAMSLLSASGLPARPGAPAPNPDPLPADVLNHGKP
jgi:hypothetical protein